MEESIFTSIQNAGLFFRIPIAMFACMSLVFFTMLFMGFVGGEGSDVPDVDLGDAGDAGAEVGDSIDGAGEGWFGGMRYVMTSIGLYITSTIAAVISVLVLFNSGYARENYRIGDIKFADVSLTVFIIVFSLFVANYIAKKIFEVMAKTKSETITKNSYISARVVVHRLYPFKHNNKSYVFGIASIDTKGSSLGVSDDVFVIIDGAEYNNEEFWEKKGIITGIYDNDEVVQAWNSWRGIIDQSIKTTVYTMVED